MLTVTVTHLKEGYLRRNGLPRSDKATLTEHWIRNGDFLTVMTIINDPVYLTEPFVRTTDYELDLRQQVPPYPCGVVQEVDRPKGEIPHFLPGANPYMTEFATRHKTAGRSDARRRRDDVSGLPARKRTRHSQSAARPAAPPAATASSRAFRSCPVRGNVYMLLGAGGNITVSVGRDGVLMVDTGRAQMTDQVLAAIRQLQRELDLRDTAARQRRRDAVERREPQQRAAGQADSLHHQHAAPIRITPAATRSCVSPGARSPAATSPATSPTPAKAPRSSRTRTCCSGCSSRRPVERRRRRTRSRPTPTTPTR